MLPPYEPYIPKNLREVTDKLKTMMISSPRFENITGYFPGRNIDTTFYELNEGLQLIREKIDEEIYLKLREMSDKMRAYFEADPEDKTDDSIKGREVIYDMIEILKNFRRRPRSEA